MSPIHVKGKSATRRTFAGRKDELVVSDAAVRETDTREFYKVLIGYGVSGPREVHTAPRIRPDG
jgi:hypothetical protein